MSEEKDALSNIALMSHMEKIADKRVQDAIEKHQLENAHTLTDIHVRLNAIVEQIKDLKDFIKAGFPHGDPVSHRAVHEKYITEAQKRSERWEEIKTHMIQGALWSAIAFIALAVWTAIKEEVKR